MTPSFDSVAPLGASRLKAFATMVKGFVTVPLKTGPGVIVKSAATMALHPGGSRRSSEVEPPIWPESRFTPLKSLLSNVKPARWGRADPPLTKVRSQPGAAAVNSPSKTGSSPVFSANVPVPVRLSLSKMTESLGPAI